MPLAQASPTAQPRPLRTLDTTIGLDPVQKLTRALAELKAQRSCRCCPPP